MAMATAMDTATAAVGTGVMAATVAADMATVADMVTVTVMAATTATTIGGMIALAGRSHALGLALPCTT